MSWNFSQCFYYRPPVLNIFQSNTPKFHCLQWINNTVLSLKYHAFFNQAPGLKQKLLERCFFMIRTITNLAAIMKGALAKALHTCIEYVCVCVRDRARAPRVDSLVVVATLNYTSWLARIAHDRGLERAEAKGCVNCSAQKNRTRRLLFHNLKESPRQVVE